MSSNDSKLRPRVGWVDHAKGIGILLVVVGHVWRGLPDAHQPVSPALFHAVDDWIYAFHMPLFLLLSGLFLMRSAEKGARPFVLEKLGTLAYPYFLWAVLHWSAVRAIGGAANSTATMADLLYCWRHPYAHFWFLYVLFLASLFVLAANRLHVGSIGLLVAAAALYFMRFPGHGWIVIYEMQFSLIFVAFGTMASPWLLQRLPRTPAALLIIACIVLMAAMTAGVHAGTSPDSPWLKSAVAAFTSAGGVDNAVSRTLARVLPRGFQLVVALLGIGGVLALTMAIDGPSANGLKFIGRLSLEIYVAHEIFAAAARAALLRWHVQNTPLYLTVGIAVAVSGSVLLAVVARRMGIDWLYTLRAYTSPAAGRREVSG